MTSIKIPSRRFRVHRSELAVPASSEHFFEKAARSNVDVVFLDLEDSVAPAQKDAARKLAIAALRDIDWGNKTVAVRVNGLDTQWGWRDIVEVAQSSPRLDLILLPKAGGARDIEFVETLLTGIEAEIGRTDPIGIEALIETALGLANVEEIARSSDRLEALIFGVGDFIISMQAPDRMVGAINPDYAVLTDADTNGRRHAHYNDQWHHAMARIAAACRAYGLRPVDGPYTNFRDEQGYKASAARARALGFDGKWAIHPHQVDWANEVFTPSETLVAWAEKVSAAVREAAAKGQGAISIDGELVDLAHLKMTHNVLERSRAISARTNAA
ncbi:HpcH/HpaI aldolase/citrate lyase family protein [Hydrogenophaga sp. BPS33]|uniref:HpcH/HpaI aldolase/citrate lyase family protein n=1 Tax=Hydrogenophaga sp. BPS33 TaxID=2651974 RepID=UPI00131FDDAE|nr:CoA ester lyase [Hydrogenophaga sp. BPS33]QHE83399.1 CoA ester lyase [Hydrogenophaga sp. BPS33]